MKPNDKAIEAARKVVIQRATHNFFNPSFLFGVIEAALDAAYAAQFQSGDYAGLLERLRGWGGMNYKICKEAADAIEALLVERERCANELTEACELLHRLTAIIPGNDGAGEEVAKFLRDAAIRRST